MFLVVNWDSRRENQTSGHVGQKVGTLTATTSTAPVILPTAPTTGVAAASRVMTRCAIALTSAGSILVKVVGLDNYNHVS